MLSVNQRYILKANHNVDEETGELIRGVVSKSKIHFESKSQHKEMEVSVQKGVVSKSKIHFESKSQLSSVQFMDGSWCCQ